MTAHIVFVVGSAVAGGLLTWWALAKYRPRGKKGGGGRRY